MNIPLSDGVSRRRFLRGSVLAGAATWAGAAGAQGENSEGESVNTLIRPAAPAAPSLPPLAPPDRQPPDLDVPKPEKKLGWAVVGLGELALSQIMPTFGEARFSRPTALVSGHPDKARQVAEVYGVPADAVYTYENFDRIAENRAVDVVYIVLPNSLHAAFTERALRAGKHVLCEKPMAVSVAECESMIATARNAGKQLGVAYRLHYEPKNLAVMKMCREKKFGPIKSFTSRFGQSVKAPNIRLSGPLGGGPVGDMGIYCINAARYTIGEEPLEVAAVQVQPKSDPRFREVPETVAFLLRYPSGVVAECECSFGSAPVSDYSVLCEKGRIAMDPAFTYSGLRLFTHAEEDGTPRDSELMIPSVNQFASEMDAFSRAVTERGEIPTPGEMGLADMRIILAVLESCRRGGAPVSVAGRSIAA